MIKLVDSIFMGTEETIVGREGFGNPEDRGSLLERDLSEEGPEIWDEGTDEDENEELAEQASGEEAEDEDI